MFGFLKKTLKKSVDTFSKKAKRIKKRTLSEKDIDEFFEENEIEFLQANIALEVIDFLKEKLKERLVNKEIPRSKTYEFIRNVLNQILLEILSQKKIDLEKIIKDSKSKGKPACFIFLGFNGSGKTTTIAKICNLLVSKKFKPVLAAADTFRAASIEQLDHHGKVLGVKVIKHQYGSDAAAVVFDARKFAEARGYDVVLADTAGRIHTNKNLMDELLKVVRVNKPELKILVIDSLTGNDAVEQAKRFDSQVGVDCVIMTKTDTNEKGGSVISVCYAIKKPVLFLGTGQKYEDLKPFKPEEFLKEILD